MNSSLTRIRELYGLEFPADFFEFWNWYHDQPPEILATFHETLGLSLVGPFDVLAGRFDGVEPRYPAVLHWRYLFDPPEFFTVLSGNADGLHWGYWFDDPGRLSPVIAAFYARDQVELWEAGQTLFDAVREHALQETEGLQLNITVNPEHAGADRNVIFEIERLIARLPPESSASQRDPDVPTPDQMGVYLSHADDEADELLLEGKRLWVEVRHEAFPVLEEAYTRLGRTPLADVVSAHARYPFLPRLDILEYQPGDYHSFDDAYAEPSKVIHLEIGSAQLTELPDLSAFENLEKLSIWRNSLTDLPKSLAACSKIRSINLTGNELSRIPDVVFELAQLEELQLGDNHINQINDRIASLHRLKQLVLRGNPLGPDVRERLKSLLPGVDVIV